MSTVCNCLSLGYRNGRKSHCIRGVQTSVGEDGSRNHFTADCKCHSTEALKKHFLSPKITKQNMWKLKEKTKKKTRRLLGEGMRDDLQKTSRTHTATKRGRGYRNHKWCNLGEGGVWTGCLFLTETTAGTNWRRLVQHVEIRLLGLHVSALGIWEIAEAEDLELI